ncbi:Glycosyl transferases group 1 [Nakamurella panacisegetis]|uniref:Glycosyl transferases group 1 n=1 Tax=Nakamurella panacisegetis TaxID=1090615 RepID=A0A1H0PIY4_9ACTN|nr:glycosyltransferase family 1 protein [Nakamurella panacisegetis]SDP04566.1 Glycosyl transferases group 1 [Nakamurella panacisegetis]
MTLANMAENLRTTVRRIRPVDSSVQGLARSIDHHGSRRRNGLRQRIAELIAALNGDRTPVGRQWQPSTPTQSTPELLDRLVATLAEVTPAKAWLLLAVLEGELPSSAKVRSAVRAAALDGATAAVRLALWNGPLPRYLDAGPWHPVQVVTDRVLVDVHHTAQTDFATGIQRVTREATRRWLAAHDATLIGWRPGMTSMRQLTPKEVHRACWGGPAVTVPDDGPVLVPWHCTYILPELAAEVTRTGYLLSMAEHSGNPMNIIGYDLVPVTTSETSHEGLIPGFAGNLAAARYARNVVPISVGAAGEYLGWRDMLAGTGLSGPRIEPVVLPAAAHPVSAEAIDKARARLQVGGLPLVMVVGSHEPRKNHVAVLHAAELLWREGQRFCLTFIGGNSWNSDDFTNGLAGLQAAGRPIEAISAADDDLLFGGLRVARFTVFPSINEGFGLPVAESLVCGTPVITSNFGSMKEIADAGGGALLVDPRDDSSIVDAMRRLLTDDALLAELTRQAENRPVRTWDDYATETWAALMHEDAPVRRSNGNTTI